MHTHDHSQNRMYIVTMVTLFSYFEQKDSREDSDKTLLPDPVGPLSLKVPTSTIIVIS